MRILLLTIAILVTTLVYGMANAAPVELRGISDNRSLPGNMTVVAKTKCIEGYVFIITVVVKGDTVALNTTQLMVKSSMTQASVPQKCR